MADVTITAIEEMEPIYDGLARRARATLGVTSWGMQVLTLPANWDGYPDHDHSPEAFDPNQRAHEDLRFGPLTAVGERDDRPRQPPHPQRQSHHGEPDTSAVGDDDALLERRRELEQRQRRAACSYDEAIHERSIGPCGRR